MIIVGKKWDKNAIDITRGFSPLGNPFHLTNAKDFHERNLVCDQYEDWFKQQLKQPKHSPFIQELVRLYKLSKQGDLVLGCYCTPRRCHGDTIKRFLDQITNGTFRLKDF